jgi:peroxiredoxin
MNRLLSHFSRVSLVLLSVAAASVAHAAAVDAPFAGRWDAVVVVDGVEVPFPFEIVANGESLRGSFFNGERRITSTAGRADASGLTFNFDQYATKLVASFKDGQLVGEYQRPRGPYPFRAARAEKADAVDGKDAPSIDGTWVVTAKGNKGEAAWRFIARQKGAHVDATILRVDGDTGTLSGSYRDGRFVLSHFSGARPLLLEVTPAPDGTLALKQNKKTDLLGARENTARAAAIGAPTDPSAYTRMKNPAEPFRFSFPDLQGKMVSNSDDKFKGKVVLVSIGGSWCPNCHDEAPFLASLYRKYQSKGLEIVLLSFEEGDQLKNPARLRAFLKTYDIGYTALVAGDPAELAEKIPQADNLVTFPTTFILGRDGRVRRVHAGFPSPGSGAFYAKAEEELTSTVEELLTEPF